MKKVFYLFITVLILFSSCTVAHSPININGKLTKGEYKTLTSNGFYLKKTNFDNLFSLYKNLSQKNSPILYTIDLPLYSLHLIFNETLKELEENSLYDSLTYLTRQLYTMNYKKLQNCTSPDLRESYNLATMYFALPLSYLDNNFSVPNEFSKKVSAEQMLIEAHKGISISPIFSYKEDYSQYIPRGHYTENDSLKNYFKAFMWYGRMGFYFMPERSFINATNYDSSRIRMIKTSVLIYNEIKGDKRLENILEFINKITDFYIGRSDDISMSTYDTLSPPANPTDKNIYHFINSVVNSVTLITPKIVSTVKSDKNTGNKNMLCFKLFGQKYIPDSYIFQNLVYNKVLTYTGPSKLSPFTIGQGGIRAFPMGLDLASILGSETAKTILKNTGNSDYINYQSNIRTLKSEFSEIKPVNGYTYFLKFMQLAMQRKHYRQDPLYMRSKLWAKKILASVLSFWAMLRHDTILYAKQSYTAKLTAVMPHRNKVQDLAYLSPYGNVYKEMFAFCDTLSNLLKTDKTVYDKWRYKLSDCKSLLLFYVSVTNDEMSGKTLETNKIKRLYGSWKTWKNLTVGYGNNLIPSDMSTVADVHTDINTKMVLEEAVGSPLEISAVAKFGKRNILFYGGVNSYYEFKYPMKNRLTDDKWIEIKNNIPLPLWEGELIHEE